MKTPKEIEQLAKQLCNIPIDLVIDEEERYYKNLEKYDGIIQGYTQSQEDMANEYRESKFREAKAVIEAFIKGYTYQEDNDWTKGCECESSIGQTWCCNQCGLPYDTRKSKKYTEEDIRKVIDETIKACNISQKESYGDLEIDTDKIINSLNKQD